MPSSEQSDAELLGQYFHKGREDAFAELSRRYLDFVYSAALRQVEGDSHAAEDVAQTVFAELARQAAKLVDHPVLAGWLYNTTRHFAAHARRARHRREVREQKAFAMQTPDADNEAEEWRQMRPLLDEAMHELSEADRLALLLRFFKGYDLRRTGEALGLNENSARMRVQRALEKLRDQLARKGVTTATAGLAAMLAANTSTAAPAGLFVAVASASGAASGIGAASAFTTVKLSILAMKIPLSYTAVIVIASVPLILQQLQIQKARTELANVQTELNRRQQPSSGNGAGTSNQPQLDELARLRRDAEELKQLKEEEARLKSSLNGANNQAWVKAEAALRAAEAEKAREEAETEAIDLRERAVNTLKQIGLAARIFATENQDRYPKTFDEMKELAGPIEFDRYEFYPQPRTISESEPQLFLFREKEPRKFPDGHWERSYTFADGSVQTATSNNGDFSAWEIKANGIAGPDKPAR